MKRYLILLRLPGVAESEYKIPDFSNIVNSNKYMPWHTTGVSSKKIEPANNITFR